MISHTKLNTIFLNYTAKHTQRVHYVMLVKEVLGRKEYLNIQLFIKLVMKGNDKK